MPSNIWNPGGGGSGTSDHSSLINRNIPNQHQGLAINLDTTNFNKNLSSLDTDVQKALETIDELNISGTSYKDVLTVTINGQTNFTLSNIPTDATKSKLVINGQMQYFNIDYTIVGTLLTWINSFILETTDRIEIFYL